MLEHLRRAETLAQTLGDHLRLGQVYAVMSIHFWVAGDVDRAIAYGRRALALAAALGHIGLQALAHFSLGRAYYDVGDYAQAVASLEQNVATLQGDLRYERFGTNSNVAVASRTWLSYCHAERGTFTEGLAMAEDGLRLAETGNHPFSLIEACSGVGLVFLRQGDVHGPSRYWSEPWVCARTGTFGSSSPGRPQPWAWRMPWRGVSPRACRW
jgi:tetratricopeptide (TPR) repeat protein